MEIRLSYTMTLRMCLLPKTLLPWTIYHWTTVCPNKIVNHLPNVARTPPSLWSSQVAETFSATPGMSHQIGTYCQPTCAHWRIGTTHQQITATCHNTSTILNPQTHGQTSAHGFPEIQRSFMWHTVTNKPHHIFIWRHLHNWCVRLHKAGKLPHWSWDGCRCSKGESSIPSWG